MNNEQCITIHNSMEYIENLGIVMNKMIIVQGTSTRIKGPLFYQSIM